jgi:hypothetical protein
LHFLGRRNVSDAPTLDQVSVTERPLQTPCEWCGSAVRQPPTGRLLRYCDRSCRQRAYEARTAKRRLEADVDAGVVRTEPAERIVERVVRAKYPHNPAGWESTLEELRTQLADGRIGPWHAQRLQRAVALVDEQLRTFGSSSWPPTQRQPAEPQMRLTYVDERLAATIARRIEAGGGTLSTSLERLAAGLALDVDELRQGVLELEYAGLIVARRHGNAVPVDELAVHARVELRAT